jgi:cation diffusion facilitator family transporter
MSAGGSVKVIIGSLAVNVTIAIAKGVAAAVTGSGAMLAEAIHSSADCTNQLLLLVGAKQAQTPPDESHPLGYGRAAYFWSFLVALMIFFGGGIFSIREGIHKVIHPDPVEHVWAGVAVLLVSLLLEGGATIQCYRAINAQRGKVPFFTFLRLTTDVDVVVLFAENAAAVVGLCFAMAALGLAVATGDPHWDGYGSAIIGLLLTLVAAFLGREVKSLLDGERADPRIEEAFREEVKSDARLGDVLRVITLQQGPSQVLLAAKLAVQKGLVSQELIEAFNRLEERVRKRCPDVKWQFIEPDFDD